MNDIPEICADYSANLKIVGPQVFDVPGFSKAASFASNLGCYPPENLTVTEWYSRAFALINSAMETPQHFPVYRLGHGEMWFITGYRPPPPVKALPRYILSRIYRCCQHRSWFYSGTPAYGYETYKAWEIPRLREQLAGYLRHISNKGMLCLYLSNIDSIDPEQLKRFFAWCARNTVRIDQANYFHVYFIYQILLGPLQRQLLRGKKIGLVSSLAVEKLRQLTNTLIQKGAKSVAAVSVSRTSALSDEISALTLKGVDIVLIGAGVGAAKVIWDLRELVCPIIDCGYVLDVLLDADMGKQRVFCVSDDDWESLFGSDVPCWAAKLSNRNG